jgi:hypothetical protein
MKKEKKIIERITAEFENGKSPTYQGEDAVLITRLIASGYLNKDAFISVSTLSDNSPVFRLSPKRYPVKDKLESLNKLVLFGQIIGILAGAVAIVAFAIEILIPYVRQILGGNTP